MQLNWLLRYQPVVRLLDSLPEGTVLDVGSGWHGLGSYRTGRIVQTDLAFAGETAVRSTGVSYLGASAESLPLGDGAVDYSISLDMIEHLPESIREGSIQELCRVSRHAVILGFPRGRAAARVDLRLARLLALLRRPRPAWLAEHLAQEQGYPDDHLVRRALPEGWEVTLARKSGNTVAQLVIVLAEHLPVVHRFCGGLERRWRRRGVPQLVDRGPAYRRLYLLQPKAPAPSDAA
jgi:SAM-dependent methyltransferase